MIKWLRLKYYSSIIRLLEYERGKAQGHHNEFASKLKTGNNLYLRDWTDSERVTYWLGQKEAIELIMYVIEEGVNLSCQESVI